ncbi:MAG: hypothetical protein IIW53_00055 [Rikenellaceae bacterium]|jgi:hypothetical protein|nr:hypothetical protein [Rikenellaceae bacterium]MBQ5852467.1 hypothetical protein [Rikenellaceae bacterium]
MKKTVITVIITFVLTSLFWYAIGYLTKVNTTNDYSQDIIGKWAPIEVSEHFIEFTKYGTLIQRSWGIKKEFPYTIKRDIVSIRQDTDIERFQNIDFKVNITSNEDGTYLEIYDVTNLSGKYRKVD